MVNPDKCDLLQAKAIVYKDARELLKRAVDAGITGKHLEQLCSFIQGVYAEIIFDVDRTTTRQYEADLLDNPQAHPLD